MVLIASNDQQQAAQLSSPSGPTLWACRLACGTKLTKGSEFMFRAHYENLRFVHQFLNEYVLFILLV
jgi:hypothetical protein